MVLDEAIKHCEEVAKEQEELYGLCPASESENHCDGTKDCKTLKYGKNKGCLKCAEEHKQLAEWLKELQELREQTRLIPCNERLPKAGECVGDVAKYYLVQNEYGDMLVARYTHSEYWEQIYQLKPIADEIIAWCELPQSYTELRENSTYQKELNDVRQELLSRPDQYITFRDLVERFDDVDAEFNHSSWNLLQIYSNFNILIGTESEEV